MNRDPWIDLLSGKTPRENAIEEIRRMRVVVARCGNSRLGRMAQRQADDTQKRFRITEDEL